MEITIEQKIVGIKTLNALPLKIVIDNLDLKNNKQIENLKKLLDELETNGVIGSKTNESLLDEKV